MDGYEIDAATALHNALLLVGYTSACQGIGPAMFDKADIKGFDSILHFLLVKLRGASQARKVSPTSLAVFCGNLHFATVL